MPFLSRLRHRSRRFWWTLVAALAGSILVSSILITRLSADEDFEIVDQLGGNIFPSAILSVATTEANVIPPADTACLGNPKSLIAITMQANTPGSVVRIELAETPFFARSVSEFVLPRADVAYTIYPEVLWRYDALRDNSQAEPISVAVSVELNGRSLGQKVRTFSVRSVNECLLGFYQRRPDGSRRFVSTRLLFAAYVNEENPLIDGLLREALDTRIVRRFKGYQGSQNTVDQQVYALWHVLQKRHFRYSSVSNTSLSSNIVYAQRVRTFDDAIKSAQINCVDGSALFASLLRAVGITPVLVKTPRHMFVGYYEDEQQEKLTFLETTMIGDVDLDDYFPGEQLDSTMQGKTQREMSRLTFDKAKQYAQRNYEANAEKVRQQSPGYMFLEISKGVRRLIQPIGR